MNKAGAKNHLHTLELTGFTLAMALFSIVLAWGIELLIKTLIRLT